MKTDDIRESYQAFFEKRGHTRVSSDSLVPADDPTLLFTGAGMNQFKDYFLGLKTDMSRATSSQKCLRTGDLEEVGKTPYHHSFFEMLGNFSFGDYFKKEAILWAWEYLTEVLGISPGRLRISVHRSDDEAFLFWKDKVGIREDWIYRMGDKSNFWPSNAPQEGPNGPCGPCSEIYYDMSENPSEPAEDLESRRFAEIWNLVFTQYDRRDGGTLEPLGKKNIDTGMGLERLAGVLQGKKTNFEIDIFLPIHERVEKALGLVETHPSLSDLYSISDHIRAVVFSMTDGVIPSNEGRGYVIRKLIRRALWHAHQIVPAGRLDQPFLHEVVPAVVAVMGKAYPELPEAEASVKATLRSEEERFLDTLDTGLKILENRLGRLTEKKVREIPGEVIFELYDTYGFPDELTRAITEPRGYTLDQAGFLALMEEQKKRAKGASKISDSIFSSGALEQALSTVNPTVFTGYEETECESRVLYADLSDGRGTVVLDRSCFYAESGGQVGDQGMLTGTGFSARVKDTQKKDVHFLHLVEIEKGALKPGDRVTGKIDTARRAKIMRNHTATHLLHAALRKVLGTQVRQLGSLVSPEKLRFDYSYSAALKPDELRQIEDLVNAEILRNSLLAKEEKTLEEARSDGAMAFFGEKYGSKVRVVSVPGFSKELCGGTHCEATGQIGSFFILSESSVASGTRRIEAVTGEGALEYMRAIRHEVGEISQVLKTSPAGIRERVIKLQDNLKKLEKERKHGGSSAVNPKQVLAHAVKEGEISFAASRLDKGLPVSELRNLSDKLRVQSFKTVYFLAVEAGDKAHFLIGLSHDLRKSSLDARELLKDLSDLLGASGGGRQDQAQGGARNEGQLEKSWDAIQNKALEYIRARAGS